MFKLLAVSYFTCKLGTRSFKYKSMNNPSSISIVYYETSLII